VSEADGKARQAGFVDLAFCGDGVEARRDDVERLVPCDRDEARILLHALLRIRPLHRRQNAVGIVGLLHEPVGFYAGTPARGMHMLGVEVRFDFGGDSIFDLHLEKVGAGDAIVAERRKPLHFVRRAHRSSAFCAVGFRDPIASAGRIARSAARLAVA